MTEKMTTKMKTKRATKRSTFGCRCAATKKMTEKMVQMMSKVAGGKGPVLSVASHSSLDAAEAKGLVQKVRADSKAQALKNVATHALAAMPAGAPAKVAASGKVAAGKSSADIKAAAQAMAKTHMLEEASGQGKSPCS